MQKKFVKRGDTYGRLTVLKESDVRVNASGDRFRMFKCRCVCGAVKVYLLSSLTKGTTQSCGCLARDLKKERYTRHGHCSGPVNTAEHRTWSAIKLRCKGSSKNKDKARYYDRGIRVCSRWEIFENFLEDMGPRPSPQHSIDRIDVNGNYCPENCRWATQKEQCRNRANTRYITLDGVTKSTSEWAEERGYEKSLILARLRRGWSDEKAVTEPVRTIVEGKRCFR